MPSSHPSILLTLNHILAVEEFWYAVISETPQVSQRYVQQNPEYNEVFAHLLPQSRLLTEYISALSDADLLKEIALDMPWVKGVLSRYEFIQHLFNHSTYHRGQIVTMARNFGLTDPPSTDYMKYVRLR